MQMVAAPFLHFWVPDVKHILSPNGVHSPNVYTYESYDFLHRFTLLLQTNHGSGGHRSLQDELPSNLGQFFTSMIMGERANFLGNVKRVLYT